MMTDPPVMTFFRRRLVEGKVSHPRLTSSNCSKHLRCGVSPPYRSLEKPSLSFQETLVLTTGYGYTLDMCEQSKCLTRALTEFM